MDKSVKPGNEVLEAIIQLTNLLEEKKLIKMSQTNSGATPFVHSLKRKLSEKELKSFLLDYKPLNCSSDKERVQLFQKFVGDIGKSELAGKELMLDQDKTKKKKKNKMKSFALQPPLPTIVDTPIVTEAETAQQEVQRIELLVSSIPSKEAKEDSQAEPSVMDFLRQLLKKMDDGFSKVNERFDRLEVRMTNMEERMTNMEERMTNMEERMTHMEERMANMEERMTRMEERMTHMEERMTNMEEKMTNMEEKMTHMEERMANMEERMTHVEVRLTRSEERLTVLKDTLAQGVKDVKSIFRREDDSPWTSYQRQISSIYEYVIQGELSSVLKKTYSWIVKSGLKPITFFADQEGNYYGFEKVKQLLDSTDYPKVVCKWHFENKLSTNPPSIQFSFFVTHEQGTGIIEATLSDLLQNRNALVGKLLQLERQAVFAWGLTGTKPRFIGLVSPSFSGNPVYDLGVVKNVIEKEKLQNAITTVLSFIDDQKFHILKISTLPEIL